MSAVMSSCGNRPGHEPVHLDAVRAPLDRERLGQVLHARLGRRGVREAGTTRPRVRRADVDDRARRAGAEVAAAELAAQKKVPFSVMSTTVRHAFGDMSSAGTGKFAAALLTSTPREPERRLRRVERGGDRFGLADVARDGEHGRAERLRSRRGRPRDARRLRLRDDDRRAEARELRRDRLAEAGAAAGHEHARRRRRCPAGSARRADGRRRGQSDRLGHDVDAQLPV